MTMTENPAKVKRHKIYIQKCVEKQWEKSKKFLVPLIASWVTTEHPSDHWESWNMKCSLADLVSNLCKTDFFSGGFDSLYIIHHLWNNL